MNIFYKLISRRPTANRESDVQTANIPNGWGRQKYLGSNQNAVYDEQIDLNNITRKRGWIQAYAARKILGIGKRNSNKRLFYPYYSITYSK